MISQELIENKLNAVIWMNYVIMYLSILILNVFLGR